MLRLLAALPARPADPDAALLGRFAAARDEAAFAELVRRHGPAVWGVCRRRLANPADAEDAFQAAFLVLARRADALGPGACVGAWLHRVAVLTCRNVRRANRRRPAVALPADIPLSAADADARLDVDALLNRLPERDRRAVVLCHLYGFTRTEAAERLGVPEGTLSARLSRGLAKLRGATPAAVAVPAGLAASTVRAVGVWELSAAGLSPAATGAATGVIRMFWAKKLVAAAAVVIAGLTTAGVGVGLTGRTTAVAADPPKAGGLPAGWTATAELTAPCVVRGKLTAAVKDGWVVARYEVPAGFKVWEVVLAQALDPTPPVVQADPATAGVSVGYGRYLIRDNAATSLRVVRQRKADGLPAWPAARPDEDTETGAQSANLHLRPGKAWLWAIAGPFGADWGKASDAADVCLRLDHRGRGAAGAGRMGGVVGGSGTAYHGDAHCTDDGELFVATYHAYPPDEPGRKPTPKQPDPKPAAPPAKPVPPAVDLAKLTDAGRKLFAETVPVAITGTVRDVAGKPIPNAVVDKSGTLGPMGTHGRTAYSGTARTDAAGRYALWFRTYPGSTVVVSGLVAEADGFVRHKQDLSLFDEVVVRPDQPGEWDFVLARGELLAGTVPAAVGKGHVPLLVRGPSFSHTELLDDGKFRLWVPKGRYTLTAALGTKGVTRPGLADDPDPRVAEGLVITKAAVLRDVPSGSDGLVVK